MTRHDTIQPMQNPDANERRFVRACKAWHLELLNAKNEREQMTEWLFWQFKELTNGEYKFGDDWLADWWIERVGFIRSLAYLRTPEGEESLQAQPESSRKE
jgi:hypothetical protein